MTDPNPQLPWGIQQVKPGSMKTISQTKLATFAVGLQKKSRFQKAREEAEEKRRKEEEEAAKIYGQFVASFAGEEETGKTFVRGTVSAGGGVTAENSQSADRFYHMNSTSSLPKDQVAGSRAGGKEMAKMLEEMKERDLERSYRGPQAPEAANKQKLNDFDELNSSKQASGSSFSARADPLNEDEDAFTTNLYLSNLSSMVTEELLCEIFGKFGEINSIKIMWPRAEDEKYRKKNCGFVSFKRRADASDALTELNDALLYENRISVGWGKAVKIFPTPFSLPHTHKPFSASAIANEVKVFFSQFEFTKSGRTDRDSRRSDRDNTFPSRGGGGGNWDHRDSNYSSSQSRLPLKDGIHVLIPSDRRTRSVIDETAKYVATNGDSSEQMIKRREERNPEYSFLDPSNISLHTYYRWRTYGPNLFDFISHSSLSFPSLCSSVCSAYLMGDSDTYWSTEPFLMSRDGLKWIPPPLPSPRNDPVGRQKRRDRSRSRSYSPDDRGRGRGGDRSRDRDRRAPSPDRKRAARSRSRSKDRSRDTNFISDQWAKDRDLKKAAESLTGLTGAQIERARAAMRGGGKDHRLDDDSYYEFKDILDSLTIEKESIKNGMGFAFDHLDAHQEIVEMIRDSLVATQSASPPLLVARMYLISDLLHNSGTTTIKNATHFRASIQTVLPDIFYSFQEYLPSLSGRFTTKQFTDRINALLIIWTDWAIFPTAFINGLEAMVNQTESELQPMTSYIPTPTELEEDLFTLKRHAKFHGISSNLRIYLGKFGKNIPSLPSSGGDSEEDMSELVEKFILCRILGCIKQYVKNKEMRVADVEGDGNGEGDDLDGVPVDEIVQSEIGVVSVPVDHEVVVDISAIGKRDGWVEVTTEDPEGDIDGVPLAEEDVIDGVPLQDEDIDGVPLLEEEIDGAPLDEEEDIDGVPLDDV